MIFDRRAAASLLLVAPIAACLPHSLRRQPSNPYSLTEIEKRIGGRLGVALVAADGQTLGVRRPDERFAMCSTFKAVLAAAVLDADRAGILDIHASVPIGPEDLVPYAPVVEKAVAAGAMTLEAMAIAAVQWSDNAAANLLLRRIGGPRGWTDFARSHGDEASRLDRYEVALNENALGDPRDTTTPLAMAGLLQNLLIGDGLAKGVRDRLIDWMIGTATGRDRIRAGMPSGWRVGDKTGTASPPASAYNDVAILLPPRSPPAILAVYTDRPRASPAQVEAAIADVGRWAVAEMR